MPAGRPSVWTDDVRKRFIDLLRAGMSQNESLTIVGASEPSLKRCMKDNPNFGDSVKKAALEGKATMVGRVVKASSEHWTAAAWLLERKYWREYAARRPDAYTGEDMAELAMQLADIARKYIPPEQVPAFSEEVQAALRGTKQRRRGRKS